MVEAEAAEVRRRGRHREPGHRVRPAADDASDGGGASNTNPVAEPHPGRAAVAHPDPAMVRLVAERLLGLAEEDLDLVAAGRPDLVAVVRPDHSYLAEGRPDRNRLGAGRLDHHRVAAEPGQRQAPKRLKGRSTLKVRSMNERFFAKHILTSFGSR